MKLKPVTTLLIVVAGLNVVTLGWHYLNKEKNVQPVVQPIVVTAPIAPQAAPATTPPIVVNQVAAKPAAVLVAPAVTPTNATAAAVKPSVVPPVVTPKVVAPQSNWLQNEENLIKSNVPNLDSKVLHLGLIAYQNARAQGLNDRDVLTIVDYTKPSSEKRLWVLDLKTGRVVFNTWVAHGKNSGDVVATSFSNQNGSLKSSYGVFVTNESYFGHRGYSLRIQGLENGINDHAFARDIVFHGAPYVNADIIRQHGEVGHSWGCFAVAQNLAKPLIDAIKKRTLVFAYYPNRYWLTHSRFLAS